ncbi:hypothetical protein SK128_010835 [Halocaridina rubra]|uniref:Uncharacterized protein n=1 Tax=Halocaridina rubra TaxID=373956 RepID=A0AAN8XBY3_HALRR
MPLKYVIMAGLLKGLILVIISVQNGNGQLTNSSTDNPFSLKSDLIYSQWKYPTKDHARDEKSEFQKPKSSGLEQFYLLPRVVTRYTEDMGQPHEKTKPGIYKNVKESFEMSGSNTRFQQPDLLLIPGIERYFSLPKATLVNEQALEEFKSREIDIEEEYQDIETRKAQYLNLSDSTEIYTEEIRKPILSQALTNIRDMIVHRLERESGGVSRQFSSVGFPSIEVALLSLAFLTFAVFLIDLVQVGHDPEYHKDLLRGNTTSGRRRRSEEGVDDGMTDLIVLTLSSIDTISYGNENPDCGQKLLCHLNRSGWHDGFLGTASNYFVSLLLSLFSPQSGFQNNLNAAQFGKESDECTDRYSTCPSVLADLMYTKRPET